MDANVTATAISINFIPQSSAIYREIHRAVEAPSALLQLQGSAVSVERQMAPVVQLSAQALQSTAPHAVPDVFMMRQYDVDRRSNRSAWQGRLGVKLDAVKRKALDNKLLLTAHPTDMLRIRVDRDVRTHDINSRTIVAAEVLPIVLPVLKDVPMRRLIKDDQSAVVTFSMVEPGNPFEVYSALSNQLYRDDLLFRILHDPYSDSPHLLVLQIKDELATMAYSSILYVKYKATLYDEKLPSAVVEQLVAFARKRELIQW